MSNSLWHHGLQHARPPCPSPTPGAGLGGPSNSGPSNQWCHPTISSFGVPFSSCFQFSQQQGLFQWVSSLYQVAKYWSFSIGPSNEYSGLISFRMDWLDLLAVQGTFKSLLQHHSLKASISLGNPSFRAWESWRHSHAKLSRGRWGKLLTGRSYLLSSTAGNWCWGNVILQGPNEG